MKIRQSVLILVCLFLVIDTSLASTISDLRYKTYRFNKNQNIAMNRDYKQRLHEIMIKAGLTKKRETNHGVNHMIYYGDR